MKSISKIILISGILFFLSCEKDVLKPTQVYKSRDIEILFVSYTDSRCPEGVACFWAGEATVSLKISNDNESHDFTLTGIGADTTLLNHHIVFVDLMPYPKEGVEEDVSEKELTLEVSKF